MRKNERLNLTSLIKNIFPIFFDSRIVLKCKIQDDRLLNMLASCKALSKVFCHFLGLLAPERVYAPTPVCHYPSFAYGSVAGVSCSYGANSCHEFSN